MGNENQSGKKPAVNRILAIIFALIVLVAVFFAGFFTDRLTRRDATKSLEWTLEMIDKYYYGEFDKSKITEATMEGLSGLLDPYSEYYTPSEYEKIVRESSGSRAGIGISSVFVEGRGVQLVTVVGGSSAAEAGLRTGDILVSGEFGEGTVNFTSEKAFSDFIDGRTENQTFTLITSSGKRAAVQKKQYAASYAVMYTNTAEYSFNYSLSTEPVYKLSDRMDFLPDGTAYIGLTQFYGNVSTEFGKLVKQFNSLHCGSMIIDLRNNGGGFVDSMSEISGYFTSANYSEAKISMTAKYGNGGVEKFYCSKYSVGDAVPAGIEVYALANTGTASASEALLGVLVSYGYLEERNIFLSDYGEDYLGWLEKRGGARKTAASYGKGIMQSTFRNSNTGEAIKLTVAEIFWPNGNSIHGRGFTCGGTAEGKGNGCTALKTDWIVTEGDEELKSAVNIIKQR